MKRRVLAICMAAALCVGLLPTTILAETGETAEDAEESAEETEVKAADIEIGEDGTATIVLDDAEEEEKEEKVAEPEQPAEEEPEEDAEDEAEPEEVVYTAKSGSISVEVTAPYGALPEDAELKVERFAKDSKEYQDAAEAIGHDADDANMAALDISFESDGEEVEPSEAVKVSIDASGILPDGADASTLEVQHLEEGRAGQVKAEVVANDSAETEGTIDAKKATAEFEVENFSVFTVTWDDGTGTTIEVHVYSMSGTSIDEELDVESYTSTDSVITISDLVSHLEQNAAYTNTYTYRYATVVYETQQGGGYSSTAIGGEDNSVASISKSGTTYTVTTSSGTTTVTDPADIVIHLYYSIPTVTLETEDPYGETVEFTTSNNYFVGDTSSATYTWALSDDTLGTLVHPTSGQATFTWSDSAQSGDQVTVTVTMTVGDETASDTYTLTYGDDPITFTVYSQDGTTPQANARVALVDASGNTVATGTTGDDGTVTLYAPAGEYTVGVTYVYLVSEAGGGSTSRATAETTITVSDDETATGSVTLGTAVTSGPGGNTSGSNGGGSEPYYYEHIDVKVAVAETSDSDVSFSDLDAVYVYDKYGNLLYVSEDINANPGTTDYNVLFDINANEDQHSIVVSSEDTIVLVYEVKDNETGETSTYTVSYRSGDTYPADEYYPATAVNAYQLYNILYNANYASQEAFEAAWGPGLTGYNEAGISISGYTYIQIADYLCDTRTTTGQAGLDFVIYVQELDTAQDNFDFRVAKTVNNVPEGYESENIENFTFTLQELDKVQDDGEWTEAIWSTAEGNVLSTDTGTISSFTSNGGGTWSGILDFLGALEYEAEDGTNFYYYILSEQTPTATTPTQQYYGLKVTVTYSSASGVATIVVSYCTLGTQDDYPYYRTSGWTGLTAYTDTDDEGDEYTYYSIPFVNTYSTTGFDLEKVDDSGNALDGAVFTMTTTQIEGEGTTLYFTSETVDETLVYTLASSTTEGASPEISVTNGGPVSIQGIAAGTYTLTETTTPDGYATVDSFTVTIADDGTVTVSGTNVSVNDEGTVTVTDLAVTEISVEKEWVDNGNAYGTRPESITVTITGTVQGSEESTTYTLTLSNENEWQGTLSNLPKYASDGTTEITYTVTEETVNGYTGTVDNEDGTYIITNTLTGETEISVQKEWADNSDAYETRPDSITVTITGSDGNTYTLTLSDANNWVATQDELPLYDSTGTEITYTVTEEEIENYDGDVVENDDGSYTITNTLTGETEISVEKEWLDNNNVYETRPDSITVTITGSDGNTYTLTLSDENGWSDTQSELPLYDSTGTEITYTVTEEEIENYDGDVVENDDGSYTITNTLTGETEISVEKEWLDNDDAYETRPESITVTITGSDGEIYTLTLSDENDWSDTLSELPLYTDQGIEITYEVTEEEVENYNGDVVDNGDGSYTITNTLTGETEISVEKDWVDNDDENKNRPESIIVTITGSDGNTHTLTLNDENKWSDTLSELPKYDSTGTEITYEVTEEEITGYDGDVADNGDGTYTITNTLQTTQVSVIKAWSDDGNRDGLEPDSVQVQLKANGEDFGDVITLEEDDDWTYTWNDLPVCMNGEEVTYTVEEIEIPDGYTASYTSETDDDGNVTFTMVNTHEDALTQITVNKEWQDADDENGTRPDDVTVQLIANGVANGDAVTLDESNGWSYTWEDLYSFEDGELIEYTVEETAVDGYTTKIGKLTPVYDGNNLTGYTITVTNTRTGETEVSVEKEWVDNDNKYETRPGSITVTITGSDGNTYTLTLSNDNDWSATQSELPLYDENGEEITYEVTEETVNGYTGTVVDNENGTYTITNTLETVDVEGSKTWVNDSDDKYSTRPESITITLLADGEEFDTITVTADDDWAWSFTDLPKYQAGSTTEVTYTITEDAVPGYTSAVNDYDVTNTLITTEVSGEKTWVDEDNADDTRPDSITIYLYADGVQTGDSKVVTSSDNWAWEFTNLPKYQSDGTTEVVYTIMEGETEEGHLGEYIPSYSEDGLSVTNALPEVSKYVSDPAYDEDVSEELEEDEADNNDTLEYEIKAEHVGNAHDLVFHDLLDNHLDIETLEIESVTLYEDAEDEGTELEAGADYTYTTDTCDGTDCNMDGCSFEIKILDDDLAGLGSDAYIVIIFDITLKEDSDQFDDEFVAETDNWANISFFSFYATPVEVETYSYGFDLYKYDEDTEEPLEGVEFVLSKDGENGTVYAQFDVDEEKNTYLLDAWVDSEDDATPIVTGSDGKAVIEGLHDGTFSIEETKAPEGYQQKKGTMTVTIIVDEENPLEPTIEATNATVDGVEVQIANTPSSDETIEIIGSKTWADSNDADEIRPASITIHLYAGEDEVDSATVTADDNWAWSFKDLPVYDEYGEEITYTITEDPVDDYDTTVNGYNVTNTHQVVTRDISGSKTWDDDDDKADARPGSITVNLYRNGDPYKTETVTESDGWAWSWTDLPMYDKDGNAYVYTITEDEVEYYTPTYYDGNFNIKNTFIGEEGAEQPPTSGPNEGGDHPKTGDMSNLGTWLALLIAAMACALVGFRMRKRS